MPQLKDAFTSTGAKFFHHQEAMRQLRAGKGRCITTHVMATDICNHSCAFCSVQTRAGDTLRLQDIRGYLNVLLKHGLQSVILSGGGNPILYKCPETGFNFNDLVEMVHGKGLEIGLITNGMPLKAYDGVDGKTGYEFVRLSWKSVRPETLDRLTWVRISMAGLDHEERDVYVPDIDPTKTTLGFSYVAHDLYPEPADPHHGKVSTLNDLLTLGTDRAGLQTWWFKERVPQLTQKIGELVRVFKPKYVRLLPNCLEPHLIEERCGILQEMADRINSLFNLCDWTKDNRTRYCPDCESDTSHRRDCPRVYAPCFVQYKPPAAPKACYLGYVHPVLNCDGFVYPCDSCVLNEKAGHKFAESWRVCHWSEVGRIYEESVRSLIRDPAAQCPGCVFTQSNAILGSVVDGTADLTPPVEVPEHANFI